VRRGRLACAAGAAALCASAGLAAWPGPAIASSRPALRVRAAILIENTTGRVLDAVNPNQRLPIASATKLMTALLTLEHLRRLGTTFTQNNYVAASVDSQIGLAPGERMSVHDLLLALLLPSADDAAEDLAFNVGHGSVGRFVGMMNARARQLGLGHTHYSTPIGLDTPDNYSSASDLVKLASFLLAHSPFFARVVALPHAVLHSGSHPRSVTNRNDLVGRVPWINGVKTGHTSGAGYVLVGSGTRGEMTLLSAVLGTSSASARDANTLALLDYGFANFRLAHPVVAGSVLARPTVRDRPGVHAAVIAASTLTRLVGATTRLTVRVDLPHQLAGPLKRHAVVGSVIVLAHGRPIARTLLLLARALPAVSPLTLAARFITRPSTLAVLALLLGAVLGLAWVWRGRRQGRPAAGSDAP
jgi:serine-type D-Ala-D-Ala carboxypeptidase (penicillin-binding protein 5/6)